MSRVNNENPVRYAVIDNVTVVVLAVIVMETC